MRSSDVAVCLFNDLDPAKLARDLDGLAEFPMVRQPGRYHDGEWVGVSLNAEGGRYDNARAGVAIRPYEPTEALQRAPYVREILDRLSCPRNSVRLLALPPQGEIRSHRDLNMSFEAGQVRLHIPIITHSEVEFVIGGERQAWRPGELWFGDFIQLHHVINNSSIVRYHVVIDAVLTRQLLALFPHEFIEARRARGIPLHPSDPPPAAADLSQYEGEFVVEPETRHINIGPERMLCELRAVRQSLELWREGRHFRTFECIGPDEFAMVTAPAGVRLRFLREGDGITCVTYEVTGIPIVGEQPGDFRLESKLWTLERSPGRQGALKI